MTNPKLTQEALDGMGDDALATIAVEWKTEAKHFNEAAGMALFELERRLEESGATKLDTEHWEGTLASKGYTHTIEDGTALYEALREAGVDSEKMDAEVWPQPPQPPRRWDQSELNELAKLGGQVAAAIDTHRRRTPNRKALALKAKQAEEVEG